MEMVKCSGLNPLASTFVPINLSGAVANEASVFATERDAKESISNKSVASVASYHIKEIMEDKRTRRDNSLTKLEMVSLIQKLICYKYHIRSEYEMLNIRSYLSDKIPNAVLLNLAECDEVSIFRKTNFKKWDILTYRPPSQSILLVSYFGLNRHEQALRPMLSLPNRPDVLQDKVWSFNDDDLKLWNRSVVRSCNCPPMFGYAIPSEFFGNPLKLSNLCPMNEIHVSCSEESEDGNEYILHQDARMYPIVEQSFIDFEETVVARADLGYYSEQLKAIVSSVYNIIDELEKKCSITEDLVDEGYGSFETFPESLWNADITKLNVLNGQIEEDDDLHPLLDIYTLEDDDFHSLLDIDTLEDNKVSMEIKEMLRKSLSNESDTEIIQSNCSFPCSVWCSKLEGSESLQTRTNSDSTAISLLSETTELISGISEAADHLKLLKPRFKRYFSANDCDPSYDCKTKIESSFIKLSPSRIKAKGRSDSWKDSDSGIVTQWSSQEDVFCEEDSGEGLGSNDEAPMWSFFSGENSLWKPLTVSDQSMSHKRVRDPKPQASSVN